MCLYLLKRAIGSLEVSDTVDYSVLYRLVIRALSGTELIGSWLTVYYLLNYKPVGVFTGGCEEALGVIAVVVSKKPSGDADTGRLTRELNE